jgi:hypothetical protein
MHTDSQYLGQESFQVSYNQVLIFCFTFFLAIYLSLNALEFIRWNRGAEPRRDRLLQLPHRYFARKRLLVDQNDQLKIKFIFIEVKAVMKFITVVFDQESSLM